MQKRVLTPLLRRRSKLPPIFSPILDGETGWYEGWYFVLRLEEEVSRAIRHRLALTVVVIYLKTTMRRKSDGLNQTLRTIARSRLRRGDLPAIRSDRELVICLTHTSATQAEVVIERLRQAFEPFGVTIGAATMPDDARDPLNLLLIAEHRAKGAAGQILYA